MWNCMVIAFQAAVGGFLWGLLLLFIASIIAGISYIILSNPTRNKKPEYKGEPIVMQGGKKKDDNDNK